MIKPGELTTYLVVLSKNGWDITFEDNNLMDRSPGIVDLNNSEVY